MGTERTNELPKCTEEAFRLRSDGHPWQFLGWSEADRHDEEALVKCAGEEDNEARGSEGDSAARGDEGDVESCSREAPGAGSRKAAPCARKARRSDSARSARELRAHRRSTKKDQVTER